MGFLLCLMSDRPLAFLMFAYISGSTKNMLLYIFERNKLIKSTIKVTRGVFISNQQQLTISISILLSQYHINWPNLYKLEMRCTAKLMRINPYKHQTWLIHASPRHGCRTWVELFFDLRHSNSGQRLLAQIQVGEENQRYDCLA